MLLKTKGIATGVTKPIVAKVTRNQIAEDQNQILISEGGLPQSQALSRFSAILTDQVAADFHHNIPIVFSIKAFEHLSEGDIIVVNPDGVINTLYRVNSRHNFLLVTERCNSNCLMCSQPPRDRNDVPYLFEIYRQLIPLIPKDCPEIGITGGEPTLMGDLFFDLLSLIKNELPDTEVHCLTNGRSFAWPKVAEQLGQIEFDRLMLGIPLYSDYYQNHDYIVQAKNAFNQTIQGLYNLAVRNQRIEIRVVLHKQSIPRLTKLAKYIYKNLPFVEHVAFMGLEYQGYTPHNVETLWIDPMDYMHELQEAVEYLSLCNMNVSIYNLQLCLMPRSLWKYHRKSISDWKNIYVDECSRCSMKEECGGFFASSEKKRSSFIRAIEER